MKHLVLALALFSFNSSFSQSNYDNIQLEKKEDYKAAEKLVLESANKVLSMPFDRDEQFRLETQRFILRWMTGTPDYNFSFEQDEMKYTKGNDDLLGIYILAQTKFVLEHPESAHDSKMVNAKALDTVVDYCENPANNIKMTKGLRKWGDSRKKA